MCPPDLPPFSRELERLTGLLGGRREHARFLLQDLADEAGFTARRHGLPFCQALRAAVSAFQIDFVQSRDAALAHTAACARLKALVILSGRD